MGGEISERNISNQSLNNMIIMLWEEISVEEIYPISH